MSAPKNLSKGRDIELQTFDDLNDALARAEAIVGIIRAGLEDKIAPDADDEPNYSASDLFGARTVVLENIGKVKLARDVLDKARMARVAR